ncbi:MAG: hypothetical protein AAGK92_09475 [Pseudomonadota bacterium]
MALQEDDEDMRRPIQVQIVSPEVEQGSRSRIVSGAKLVLGLIKDIGAISALALALLSAFPAGKAVIVDLFALSDPEEPTVTQVEAGLSSAPGGDATDTDLSPIGWSYLGKEDASGAWYYSDLDRDDMAGWTGQVVRPETAIYLRATPVSAVNPDPVALTVIGDDAAGQECLRVIDHRISNTGSIWLQGALARCR